MFFLEFLLVFKKEYNLLLSKKTQMLLLFKEIEESLNKLLEYKV